MDAKVSVRQFRIRLPLYEVLHTSLLLFTVNLKIMKYLDNEI